VKSILILFCGHPHACDDGFGYHVYQVLEKMDLPENVELLECGYSASESVWIIDGKDKMIVVDVFRSSHKEPGTIVHMQREEVELTVNGSTDVPKYHLMEILDEINISGGKSPETVFIGVVPKEQNKKSEVCTPEVDEKIPEVVDMILQEINKDL
jgi:hydrogenase maturation protease